jgi:hypothetical protein
MNQIINSILLSIKYNKKKIILKKTNITTCIALHLLKMNLIKNVKFDNKFLILSLNFLKNKPILKNISKRTNKQSNSYNIQKLNFRV